MNRNIVLATATSAAVLALAACGADVKHGTIIAKQYDPAKTNVYFQPVYGQRCVTRPVTVRTKVGSVYTTRTSTVRSCSSYVTGHIPVYNHQDACYQLTLKNSSGDTGTVCVSKDAWDSAKTDGSQQW